MDFAVLRKSSRGDRRFRGIRQRANFPNRRLRASMRHSLHSLEVRWIPVVPILPFDELPETEFA
eukprot:12702572-Alexandrium_andersonii.AAC.1